jgi:hypothetical protein
MLRGSRHLDKILGYSFSPIKVHLSLLGSGVVWRRQWELLDNRVYNKPNGCSANGALAPGPDHQPTIIVCVSQHVYCLLSGIEVCSVYGYYKVVNQLLNLCTVERNVPEHSGNCEVRSNISWNTTILTAVSCCIHIHLEGECYNCLKIGHNHPVTNLYYVPFMIVLTFRLTRHVKHNC